MRKNQNKTNSITFLVGLAIVSMLLLVGCTENKVDLNNQNTGTDNIITQGSNNFETPVFDPDEEIKAMSFANDKEYIEFLKNNAGSRDYYYGAGLSFRSSVAMESAMPVSAPSAGADKSESANDGDSGAQFSETNNQVQGIDEADILKTDGEYIYTITGDTVFIIKAVPGADGEVVSKLTFSNSGEATVDSTKPTSDSGADVKMITRPYPYYYPTNNPQGLFLKGNYLVVFGTFGDLNFFKDMNWRPSQGMTFFNVYDISDKEKPSLVKEYKFEGNYFQARMSDGYVYFVTTTNPESRRDYPTPLMFDGTELRSMPAQDIYYFNIPYSSVQLANINAINLNDLTDDVESKSVAVEYGQNMYMSKDNIFITYTKYINEWEIQSKITLEEGLEFLNDADKEVVAKIRATDDDVLSKSEKDSKILNIVYSYINYLTEDERTAFNEKVQNMTQEEMEKHEYVEYTIINKISVNNGNIEVSANGKIPGHISNQFSMDEENGVFRIATTLSARWSSFDYLKDEEEQPKSSNNVFTLDSDLEILDSIKGIAKGEQIYSTRFIGDKLYMVTFRQIDPFFVVDLSDAEDIKMLGELKIPGYSRYLHPYDENTIIGIGRETTSTGQVKGLKISLFDVSDFENPKEIAKFTTSQDYAQSTAEYEHKAFLFNREKNLLVIPAYSYSYNCWGDTCATGTNSGFNGAMVFNISKESIKMRGVIDHSQGQAQYWSPQVERSLFIDDMLYTKSPALLRINKLSDLSKVKNIVLESNSGPYPVY